MSVMKRTPFGSLDNELKCHLTDKVHVGEDHHVVLANVDDLWRYVNGFHGGHDQVRVRRLAEAVFAHPSTMERISEDELIAAFVGLFRVWRNGLYTRMLQSANGCDTLEALYAKIDERRAEFDRRLATLSADERDTAEREAAFFTARFRKEEEVDKLLARYMFRAVDVYLRDEDARSAALRERLKTEYHEGVFTPKPELQ